MSDDTEKWKNAAQSFESSLMILRKDKNGWVIGFSVHPNEAPAELLDARLGTRFRQVLFQIDDNEQPIPVRQPGQLVDISGYKDSPISEAGKICRNKEFQAWIVCRTHGGGKEVGLDEKAIDEYQRHLQAAEKRSSMYETLSAHMLRLECGIESRAELHENQEALDIFTGLKREFREFQMRTETTPD
jgi:hypothetical protein